MDHANEILPGMTVVGMNGNRIGTVDGQERGAIKLTRRDGATGFHSFVPLGEVATVRGGRVWIGRRHLPNEALRQLGIAGQPIPGDGFGGGAAGGSG
ncbi:MAG: DUF2171 domain-containing protein [Acetobacteraceae bacterium]|nr:DUF2171 domain-containing protein [Acetobacteraceae bacterium]